MTGLFLWEHFRRNQKSYIRHEDFLRLSVRSSVTLRGPPWILKRAGLESSGRRLISSIGKTKIIALYFYFFSGKKKYFQNFQIFWKKVIFLNFSKFFQIFGFFYPFWKILNFLVFFMDFWIFFGFFAIFFGFFGFFLDFWIF